jgi:hypothetical protein
MTRIAKSALIAVPCDVASYCAAWSSMRLRFGPRR